MPNTIKTLIVTEKGWLEVQAVPRWESNVPAGSPDYLKLFINTGQFCKENSPSFLDIENTLFPKDLSKGQAIEKIMLVVKLIRVFVSYSDLVIELGNPKVIERQHSGLVQIEGLLHGWRN